MTGNNYRLTFRLAAIPSIFAIFMLLYYVVGRCRLTLCTTGLRPLCRKKMAFWSAGPKCGPYFHAAESGRQCDQMTLSIPDLCACAIRSRPFGLPYGLCFTTQGPESRRNPR
jgi:hypothetical protein